MPANKVSFNNRLKILWAGAIILGGVIALRLADIQVLRHDTYEKLAEQNRTQILFQTAPRGRVFTADGIAVASNAPSFSFYYLASGSNQDPAYLSRFSLDVAPYIKKQPEEVLRLLQEGARTGKATLLADNLSTHSAVALRELQQYYPGVYLLEETKRIYPYGSFASHLLGYIGNMTDSEWRKRDQSLNYLLSSKVGKNGIEKKYEQELKGTDGGVYLEVDHRGRVKSIIQDKKWVAGSDVFLTLNFDVQKAAEDGLKNSKTGMGAAVALDARNGAVLALASAPAYDPNMFVPYSDEDNPAEFKRIDEYNLAIQGIFPPASTFKIITAAAALEEGDLNPRRKVECTGHYDTGPRVFKCWGTHGPVNFWEGMSNSCDVYFYAVAAQTGPAAIERVERKFMIGRRTGIDLAGEKAGNLYGPTRRARNKTYWFIGDTLNLSIGQGELLFTPLKMAQFAAAVASRGNVYRPYYVEKIVSNRTGKEEIIGKPEILQKADLRPETYDKLFEALKYTVDTGTARRVKIKGLDVYGKTGTAQNPHGADHGWFMAFAGREGEEPVIAVAVLVAHGEGGSSAAGPIARSMLEAYFGLNKPSNPPDGVEG